jgi:hypothetical protein
MFADLSEAKLDRGHRWGCQELDQSPLSSILRIDCRAGVGAKTASIALGSPRENGYCESFNGRMRDALQNGNIFYVRREVQIMIER